MLGGILAFVAVAFTLTIGMLNFLNFTIPALFMLAAMTLWALVTPGAHVLGFGLHWLPAALLGTYAKSHDGVWWCTRKELARWYLQHHKEHIS